MVLGFVCTKKIGCSHMKSGAGVCYGQNHRDKFVQRIIGQSDMKMVLGFVMV